MSDVESIVNLGKYGAVGVMIALILLCGATIYMLWKFATTHVEHSNMAFNENTKALTKLTAVIEHRIPKNK